MREERTNRKTTSIARKIHVGYWFRRFFALLGLDIVILGMLFVAVLVWRLDTTDADWMSGAMQTFGCAVDSNSLFNVRGEAGAYYMVG